MNKKRVFELHVGDLFWFSGCWRKVVKIDATLLHYTSHDTDRKYRVGKNDTIMKNSQMIVQII